MAKRWSLVGAAVVVGIALIATSILYFAEPAGSLPSFFPGHDAGSSHHHAKHGSLALILLLLLNLGGPKWASSGSVAQALTLEPGRFGTPLDDGPPSGQFTL